MAKTARIGKDNTKKMSKKVHAFLVSRITVACEIVSTDAKLLCKVITGNLRDSIGFKVIGNSKFVKGFVGTNVDYAPHKEFGTKYQDADPFLRPALINNEKTIKGLISGK